MSISWVVIAKSAIAKKLLKWLAKWEYNRAKEREAKREADAIRHANGD